MSMMMRRGMMVPKAPGGLPSEYLQVEYIQAVPGSYINSGYVPTVAPRIETRIQIMSNSDSDLFGFENNTFPSFIVDATNYGSIFYNRWGQIPSTQFTPSQQLKTPTDCVFGKTTIIGSNEYIDAFGDVDWSSNVQVVYIGRGRNVTCDVRIYSCKLYDGTALVRDMIPCIRISDSEPGMYDLVGRQFYTNAGTGEFVAGHYVLPYPVGTNLYDNVVFTSGEKLDNTGEIIEGTANATCHEYLPVDPAYTYERKYRLYTCAMYDENFDYIGSVSANDLNTSTVVLDSRTRYIRCTVHSNYIDNSGYIGVPNCYFKRIA